MVKDLFGWWFAECAQCGASTARTDELRALPVLRLGSEHAQ